MCTTRWPSCLRHCAKIRKISGSFPDGVIGRFHQLNPSGRLGNDSAYNRKKPQELFLGLKAADEQGCLEI